MADKDGDNVEDEQTTIATDLVVTKYKMAAEIVNGNKLVFYFLELRTVKVQTYRLTSER